MVVVWMFVIGVAEIEAKHDWTHDNNELNRRKVISVLTPNITEVKWALGAKYSSENYHYLTPPFHISPEGASFETIF